MRNAWYDNLANLTEGRQVIKANDNPGNFANDKTKAIKAGQKGGQMKASMKDHPTRASKKDKS